MGTDKFLGYPLAILSGMALLSPRSAPLGQQSDSGSQSPTQSQTMAARPVDPSAASCQSTASCQSPASTQSTPRPQPAGEEHTVRPARPSAESPELRALRLAERQLFSEMGSGQQGDMTAASTLNAPVSCEPQSDEWNQSKRLDVAPSPAWLKGLNVPDLPVPRQQRIAKYIRYFATTDDGRRSFTTWLQRSGRYNGVIEQVLAKHGLPSDLKAVVFVESGCSPTAVSSAGATGLWQLMPQTARAYGLAVNPDYDERRSIWRSTEAAATHLADLYAQFGSWHLALAAYNAGYERMLDRMQQQHVEDFWSLADIPDSMPQETALYVPKVLAIATLLRNLEYFGFDGVEEKHSVRSAAMEVPSGVRLSLIARAAGTSLRLLKELNPEFKSDMTPEQGGPISIHLPTRGIARAKSMLSQLIDKAEREPLDSKVTSDFDWGRDEFDSNWRTRLQRTGRHHDADDDALSDANTTGHRSSQRNLDTVLGEDSSEEPKSSRADSGSKSIQSNDESLINSQKHLRSRDEDRRTEERVKSADADKGKPRFMTRRITMRSDAEVDADSFDYRVRPGDTLSHIANLYGTREKFVIADNRLRNPSYIQAGQVLKLRISLSDTRK